MSRSGLNAASAEGFTLLEVVVAAAIFATSAAAVVAIYVRATERANDVRDLSVATVTARNAVEETFAEAVEFDFAEGDPEAYEATVFTLRAAIPERPSLILDCRQETPFGEELVLTDNISAGVSRDGEAIVEYATKRAVFLLQEDLVGEEDLEREDEEEEGEVERAE
ncbi:MAG: prepilin-type N-terminal cleavage/methylation domain-containing protein [Planctomycetota bacterium]|jgi:prepilin-type N-terminal cleavage/methylation domain-containing protein